MDQTPDPEHSEDKEDKYDIKAHSHIEDTRERILKRDGMFAVFNVFGDIWPTGKGVQGLYQESTRHLSRFEIRINGEYPLLLSSTVRADNSLVEVDLSNPDLTDIPKGSLHFHRSKFLWQNHCYEELEITNFSNKEVEFFLFFLWEADFADIFEIRGMTRKMRGELFPGKVEEGRVVLSYRGLDKVERQTELQFNPRPGKISVNRCSYGIKLRSHGNFRCAIRIMAENQEENISRIYPTSFSEAQKASTESLQKRMVDVCRVSTSDSYFNEWINRSFSDVQMLLSETTHGMYPYAGVPWFSTPFGRDGLLTAQMLLWVNPDIAKGVLNYLARTQSTENNPQSDANPGKILHEARQGEMSNTGEVPFRLYYGSIDSTPLFIVLAGQYYIHTGDIAFIRDIWPNILMAIAWIDNYGDLDGDGFVEYQRSSQDGLINQGWKDSHDSIFHEDGTFVTGPVALCEVQGYVYEAKLLASELASVLGEKGLSEKLKGEAHQLQEKFEAVFWCERKSLYALALDGQKRPCQVASSNAGHVLFSGMASLERARRVGQSLFRKNMYTGWGIRTIASSEALYNPMSYHNGSVWPHDNAILALGLSRYGLKGLIAKLLTGFFNVSHSVDLYRLPELFCGLPRRMNQGPTLYPVACIPQAWAAASVFAFIQASLGLRVDGPRQKIIFHSPYLPKFLEVVSLNHLRVGNLWVDLSLRRHAGDVGVVVSNRMDKVEVHIVK